jgi:uncharacterized membrane protein YdfJ with MMPL/SSD domain
VTGPGGAGELASGLGRRSNVARTVVAALADLALRRPWAALGANLVALGLLLFVAAGAPGRLATGSLALGGSTGGEEAGAAPQPDLVIATTGRIPIRSGAYRVALGAIASKVRADPAVASVRRGPVSVDRRSTSLEVFLSERDDSARERDVQRIEAGIDPGPLRIAYGGEVTALLEARHDLSGDLWRLELLALPFTLLVLAWVLGPRLAIAPVICAATGIAGSLAALRFVDTFADLSLLGIAPAAVLGLVLGVEAPCLLTARCRDEAASAPFPEAIRRAVASMGRLALPLGAAAAAAAAGLLTTTLDQAGSMVLACAVATSFVLASTLVSVPALLALGGGSAIDAADRMPNGSVLARATAASAGFLARSRLRTLLAAVIAAVALLGAASSLLRADSRPFSAADLPTGAQARMALIVAAGGGPGSAAARSATSGGSPVRGASGQSLFDKLAVAAGVSGAGLAIVLLIAFRSLRVLPVALITLLPAAASCGLCVLVFQDGYLASALGQRRQGALETGAVAALLAGLVAVSAARGVSALRSVRAERGLRLAPELVAETAAGFTVPAATAATLVGVAAAAVLAGSDLYSAREFGLAVAAGLLIDLVLLRVPLVAVLARWGGED